MRATGFDTRVSEPVGPSRVDKMLRNHIERERDAS